MKVVIRADASPTIGIGHLTRCFALAQALIELGEDVVLATVPSGSRLTEPWRREGATVRMLDVTPGSAADADATRDLVSTTAASWLCVDGYAFGPEFHGRARGAARLAVVDDFGAPGLDANLVVNGNVYAEEGLYPGTSAPVLSGPRFALLRREFRRGAAPDAPRSGVLVSLGGADPDARTAPLLEALTEAGVRGTVVVGPQHTAAEALRAHANTLGWRVLDAPATMEAALGGCEVAVIGAGTTTLEALALGTPMVAVRIADNQRLVIEALHARGLAVTVDGADGVGVAAAVRELLDDPARRSAMAQRAQGLVDGRGALRVAEALREPLVELRPATMEDSDRLLAWRNDPVTRAGSLDTAPVSPGTHREWMKRTLGSTDRVLRVAELEGRPIGAVRLDRHDDAALISITLSPEARGRRLAPSVLRHAAALAGHLGIRRIDATIRVDNVASRRAFAAAGFEDSAPPADDAEVIAMHVRPRGTR